MAIINQTSSQPAPSADMNPWERRALDQGLFEAVQKDDFYDVRRLVARGASPDLPNSLGHTALSLAAHRNLAAIVSVLLPASRINEQMTDGRMGLEAILSTPTQSSSMLLLLQKLLPRIDFNATNANGATAAHFLAQYQEAHSGISALQDFIQACPLSAWSRQDADGNTPLLAALSAKRYPQALEILPLSDPRIANNKGLTAIDLANGATPSRNFDFQAPWRALIESFELAQTIAPEGGRIKPKRL